MADEPLPALVPLTLVVGDSRTWTDVIERNTGTDAVPVWVPYDLTGHTFLAQIRASRLRTATLYATIAVTATNAAGGEIELVLTSAEADGLAAASAATPPNKAWWDLQIVRTLDGFKRTHLAGKVKILGDVSHV